MSSQHDNCEESINEYMEEIKKIEIKKAIEIANELPKYQRKLSELSAIEILLSDLSNAFAGKPLDYQREFSANTRTDLAKSIMVDELNFQFGRS